MNEENVSGHLEVEIRDSLKVYFSGSVVAISTKNANGPFDILTSHQNFISVLLDDVKITLPSGEVKSFPCQAGIMKVNSNKVNIFLNVEIFEGEIDKKIEEDSDNYYNKRISEERQKHQ